VCTAAIALLCTSAQADLIDVSGPNSSRGSMAQIIAAPADALDDIAVNLGMQGFNEAQDVVTTSAWGIDGGGSIAAGTLVDSHMIFLNTATGSASHGGVTWTFAGVILGVMSDYNGNLESASTANLGAPGTNYTTTGSGTGPAAPFPARGIEGNNGTGLGTNDGYLILSPNQLRVSMFVGEPGDWIRVVTAAEPIPEPSTLALLGIGAVGLAVWRRRRKND
jgi:hypothetical protein